MELRITGIVAPGQVFMPFHFPETNSNLVTLGAFDPISREPNFKQCAVRVEKFNGFDQLHKMHRAAGYPSHQSSASQIHSSENTPWRT